MSDITLEIITIEWHPRIRVEVEEENWDYSISQLPKICLTKSCFYCIYGAHPVYGEDVLLYIGETKKNEGGPRTIEKRLKEHLSGRFWGHTELSFSIGTPETLLSHEKIKAVESILIAAHKPALNRASIDEAGENARNLLVQNYGFCRSLMTECSGSYWCKERE